MEQPTTQTDPCLMETPAGLSSCLSQERHEPGLFSKNACLGELAVDLLSGFTAYYLTSLPVLIGVIFGAEFLYPTKSSVFVPGAGLVESCIHFDAIHYLDIIQNGYSYRSDQGSLVAFFPLYPLFARWLHQATNLPAAEAALLAANLALFGAFVMMARVLRLRWPEATAGQRALVLTLFGLWPLGLFFRMPYAESLFTCCALTVLYGMARGWSIIVLALLTGLATAIRPVGVALTAAFIWFALTQPTTVRSKAQRILLLAPLACWGLLAYMAYQWITFDTPWAFAQTQSHWSFFPPKGRSGSMKAWSLLTFEPIWGVYLPGSRRYWTNSGDTSDPFFSLIFWNPILFVLGGVLLLWGGWKRWLNGSELVFGVGLLAIPYLTRSYEMSMASHGRFAAVITVNYLVMGRLLAQAPPLAIAGICSVLALWLCLLSSLYTANHLIF